jgi:hypothetical protein
MDDKKKSVIDKFKDTVSEAIENMASAMAPTAEQNRSKIAATTNEQVYVPEATDAAALPAPLFAAPARKRKTRAKTKPPSRAKAKKAARKTGSSAPRKAAAKKRPAKKVLKKRKSKR